MEGLPADSAAARAVLGHDWTQAWQWLLADIRDGVAQLLVLTSNINRPKGKSPAPQPDAAWRPETSEEARELMGQESPDEIAETEAVTAELQATADRIFS